MGLHPAAVIFEDELRRRDIEFARTLDGRWQIEHDGATLVLSLENVMRDFDRDGDPSRIVFYLESALGVFAPLPPWEEARGRVYWSPESSKADFGEALHESVTECVSRVLVYADLEAGRIRWLTPKARDEWHVSTSDLDLAARENLDRLLHGKRVRVERANGRELGMVGLDVEAEPLKASVVFAPGLKEFVAADLGWPVLAVIPCRDFVYLFGEGSDLLDVLGSVVQKEFRTSGYPITTEVLRISDNGIEGIGRYPE